MKSISLNEAADIPSQESLIFQYSIIEEFETSTYQKNQPNFLQILVFLFEEIIDFFRNLFKR